jgi:lipoprotein-anchoring transpeptidase ErfK/SrfK
MNIQGRDSRIMRVSGHRISIADIASTNITNLRFWQIAILTAAGTIGTASQADAALSFWQDQDPGYYRPAPTFQPRRQRTRRHSSVKAEAIQKETGVKPQGPLIIAISIEKQKVRIYDANGFFAESPVSTGMRGHPTPMGVFSVIQKHKFHHSNIYSGAPMPYMQRITWSGIAMHAGVLPGYPASHGCIRMPMAFAVKMWNWTKMGARVIVTPGEMTPADFSHPLLVTQKGTPGAIEEPKSDAPLGVKTDKGADAGAAAKPTTSDKSELRSTVGHAEPPASTPRSEQTRTADASGILPAIPVSMSDAISSAAPPRTNAQASSGATAPGKSDDAFEAKSEAAKPETGKAEAKSSEVTTDEVKSAAADKARAPAYASSDPAKPEVSASDGVKVGEEPAEAKLEAKTDDVKTEAPKVEATKVETSQSDAPKADEPKASEQKTSEQKASEQKASEQKAFEPKPVEKPAETVKAVADAPAVGPDAKKDPARLPDAEKAVAAKPEPPKRTGRVSVLISRKDAKLYVRQNFAPLFDAPVTIAPGDRPLGTHVFTAEADKNDANVLRWSVVSLPVSARNAARNDDGDRPSRRRNMAGAGPVAMKPLPVPDSAAEALDRITIPPDVMARITEALTTGASIIVSDQGINQGETGEGTDFIVSLR